MSPALLVPSGLAALLALAIPVVIHIARRTESRTVQFAALRWLDAAPKPRRSLTLDERLLLAARLLLLTLVAIWLAAPALRNAADTRRVVAIFPGVDAATIAAATREGKRVVWLAPGFPAVGGIVPTPSKNPISLIRQLDAELPSIVDLRVVVPSTLDGVDAERPRLSRRVEWTVGDEVPARPVAAPKPIALTVRYAPGASDAVRYFRAAATAWTDANAEPAFEAATIEQGVPLNTHALIWLAPGPIPAQAERWIRNGGVALTSLEARTPVEGETTPIWRGHAGEPLAVAGRLSRGRVIRLTRPLDPAAIPQLVEATFPDALADMLSPLPAPARVVAVDHAPLTGAAAYERPPLDLRPWLGLLIALAFAGERWLATRRQRAIAP